MKDGHSDSIDVNGAVSDGWWIILAIVPRLRNRKTAIADDQEYKRKVEAREKTCCILGPGDSVAV
jgi:hypothetical protein